jgi:NADH-ubiquinone oxidoreductase chain 4
VSLLYALLIIPVIGIFLIATLDNFDTSRITVQLRKDPYKRRSLLSNTMYYLSVLAEDYEKNINFYKNIAFGATLLNAIISLIIYIFFDFSNNQFQFIYASLDLSFYDIYLGVDGISIYFVLLTTLIMPVALVSN